MVRTRRLTLQALGVVSALAFVSLWVQIDGLVGSQGILPFATALGHDPWRQPTVFLYWRSDAALHAVCAAGTLVSMGLGTGWLVRGPWWLGLWALYLSLSQAGGIFLGYQWDTLLTETLAVAALWAPWRTSTASPSFWGTWMMRLLLLKLMIGSGLVKLTANDETWWNGTALAFHYWTQPLPNPLSWYAHHLPQAWHTFETIATLAIECVLPLAMFLGRAGRLVAAVGFTLVLAMLFATGNYGFFQLLSLVLVLSLLDDGLLTSATLSPSPDRRELVRPTLFVVWVTLGLASTTGRVHSYDALPEPVLDVLRVAQPFRTVNAYGLFASMTTSRPEITIEGTPDGTTWLPYTFRYKPGPLERRAPIAGPHMPRLDWQMWFAALQPSCRGRASWMVPFLDALARNEPAVLGLIADNPFTDAPPLDVRATRVVYAFTDEGPDTWRVEGSPRLYCARR